jgi:hypothetical protein
MNPAFLRRLAQRCWDLVRSARSGATREQLQIWAREFEAEAEHAERGSEMRHSSSDAAPSEDPAPA